MENLNDTRSHGGVVKRTVVMNHEYTINCSFSKTFCLCIAMLCSCCGARCTAQTQFKVHFHATNFLFILLGEHGICICEASFSGCARRAEQWPLLISCISSKMHFIDGENEQDARKGSSRSAVRRRGGGRKGGFRCLWAHAATNTKTHASTQQF